MCDFQMKCYILLIFHADSHVVFCPFSFTRSAWSIPLKNCIRNRNLQHLIPSGTQTKRGERISFGIFLFLLLDSMLTCVVYLAFLKDLFVKCRRDIYTWQGFNLNSTPPRINQKKKNKIRWTRGNPSGFNIIVIARGVWKGQLLKCRSQCQSILLYSQVYTVYPYTIEYKYSYRQAKWSQ